MDPLLDIKKLSNEMDAVWVARQADSEKNLVYTLLVAAHILPEHHARGPFDAFGIQITRSEKPEKPPKNLTSFAPKENSKGSHYCLHGTRIALDATHQIFSDILKEAEQFVKQSGLTTTSAIRNRGEDFERIYKEKFTARYNQALADFRSTVIEKLALDSVTAKIQLETLRNTLRILQATDLSLHTDADTARRLKQHLFWNFVKHPENVLSVEQFFQEALQMPFSMKGDEKRTVGDVLVKAGLLSVSFGLVNGVAYNGPAISQAHAAAIKAAAPEKVVQTAPDIPRKPLASPLVQTVKPSSRLLEEMKLIDPKPPFYSHALADVVLNDPQYENVLLLGSSGAAKSGLALNFMLKALKTGLYPNAAIVRAFQTSTGKNLGAMPGGYDEKVDVYYKALDANIEFLTEGTISRAKLVEEKLLQTPLPEVITGATLPALVIFDDAQNYPDHVMESLMQRVGKSPRLDIKSRLIITADVNPDQIDIKTMAEDGYPGIFNVINDLGTTVCREESSPLALNTAFIRFRPYEVVRNGNNQHLKIAREKYGQDFRDRMNEIFASQSRLVQRQELDRIVWYLHIVTEGADAILRRKPSVKAALREKWSAHLRQQGQWEHQQPEGTPMAGNMPARALPSLDAFLKTLEH